MRRAAAAVLLALALAGCQPAPEPQPTPDPFDGSRAGEERTVGGVQLCWCPAGTFVMGSPPDEPERRPGEDQVEVTLSRGFWCGKLEVTQGEWRRIVGRFPEGRTPPTSADLLPMGTVNFGEAESFCAELTKAASGSASSPS